MRMLSFEEYMVKQGDMWDDVREDHNKYNDSVKRASALLNEYKWNEKDFKEAQHLIKDQGMSGHVLHAVDGVNRLLSRHSSSSPLSEEERNKMKKHLEQTRKEGHEIWKKLSDRLEHEEKWFNYVNGKTRENFKNELEEIKDEVDRQSVTFRDRLKNCTTRKEIDEIEKEAKAFYGKQREYLEKEWKAVLKKLPIAGTKVVESDNLGKMKDESEEFIRKHEKEIIDFRLDWASRRVDKLNKQNETPENLTKLGKTKPSHSPEPTRKKQVSSHSVRTGEVEDTDAAYYNHDHKQVDSHEELEARRKLEESRRQHQEGLKKESEVTQQADNNKISEEEAHEQATAAQQQQHEAHETVDELKNHPHPDIRKEAHETSERMKEKESLLKKMGRIGKYGAGIGAVGGLAYGGYKLLQYRKDHSHERMLSFENFVIALEEDEHETFEQIDARIEELRKLEQDADTRFKNISKELEKYFVPGTSDLRQDLTLGEVQHVTELSEEYKKLKEDYEKIEEGFTKAHEDLKRLSEEEKIKKSTSEDKSDPTTSPEQTHNEGEEKTIQESRTVENKVDEIKENVKEVKEKTSWIRKVGKWIKEHPYKTGGGALGATASLGGLGYAGYRYLHKQKGSSNEMLSFEEFVISMENSTFR